MDDVNVIFGNVRKLLRWCHSTIIPSSILMCELSFMVFGHVCIIHCCVCVCVYLPNIIWDDKKIILHIMPAYNTTERMELAISRSKLNPWLKMIRITIFERANERVEMRIHLEPSWIYYSDSFYFILFFLVCFLSSDFIIYICLWILWCLIWDRFWNEMPRREYAAACTLPRLTNMRIKTSVMIEKRIIIRHAWCPTRYLKHTHTLAYTPVMSDGITNNAHLNTTEKRH